MSCAMIKHRKFSVKKIGLAPAGLSSSRPRPPPLRPHLDLLIIPQTGGKNVRTFRWEHRLFFSFFNVTYSRWTSSLPSCLWTLRIFPSLPGSCPTIFLSRCKFSTLTTRQPMIEFYLLTFPRFPLRKKEHKSYFGKNRTHDFRTSRCAGYLLDHSGDEGLQRQNLFMAFNRVPRWQ